MHARLLGGGPSSASTETLKPIFKAKKMGARFDENCFVGGKRNGAGFMGLKLKAEAAEAVLEMAA
jgi:hypothetical protein